MEKYCIHAHSRRQEQRERWASDHLENLTWERQAEELHGTDPFLSCVLLHGKAGKLF